MRKLSLALIGITFLPSFAFGHGGGLDKNGCHTNRKTGEYHCHGASIASTPSPPAASPTRSSGSVQMAWSNPVAAADSDLIKTAQVLLRVLGYEVKATGVQDAATVRAVTAFEQSGGLARTGRVSGPLLVKLAEGVARARR